MTGEHTKVIVITTINGKTPGIASFEKMSGWHVVIVADKKSRHIDGGDNLTYLSCEEQLELGYRYARLCPWNHYARKNIGYLYAISMGAAVIYDTDDDNLPFDHRWHLPDFAGTRRLRTRDKYANIYSCYTDEKIWPRGLPLDEIHNRHEGYDQASSPADVGVWQGLADEDPDVDAIYRLIFGKRIIFEERSDFYLPEGTYSPSNSQNTFWHNSVFPLMYLPAMVSFRSTDIFRGYIAQRLMWYIQRHLGVMGATVYQQRNAHDLMRDFKDELTCYLDVKALVDIVEKTATGEGLGADILSVYRMLEQCKLTGGGEAELLEVWLADLDSALAVR